MDSPAPALSPRLKFWLGIGWAVILVKCLLTPWAIERWQVPIHAAWVIVPTLIFAAIITAVVVTWARRGEPKD